MRVHFTRMIMVLVEASVAGAIAMIMIIVVLAAMRVAMVARSQ